MQSPKVVIDEDLEASCRDPDGRVRVPYFDRKTNDMLGLMHEDALGGYADDVASVCTTIDVVCRLVEPERPSGKLELKRIQGHRKLHRPRRAVSGPARASTW